jgi:hypothetical protein
MGQFIEDFEQFVDLELKFFLGLKKNFPKYLRIPKNSALFA